MIAALAGCAASGRPAAIVTEAQLALNPHDRPGQRPEIMLSGLLAGRLVSNGRCLTVVTGRGAVTPLWPVGTAVRKGSGGTEIVLPDGRGTAIVGQRARLAGGSFAASQAGELSPPVRTSCSSPYFAVSTVNK